MKERKYKNSFTFLVSDEMCAAINAYAERKRVGISDVLRLLVKKHMADLRLEAGQEKIQEQDFQF